MIDIVLVDDHSFARAGLKQMLDNRPDMRVVGEYEDGDTFMAACETLARFDVLLLDTVMPGCRSLNIMSHMNEWDDAPAVVLLSNSTDRVSAMEALASGARGLVTKDATTASFLTAIRVAHSGGLYVHSSGHMALLSDTLSHYTTRADTQPSERSFLSPTEWLFLVRAGAGWSLSEIASAFGFSLRHTQMIQTNLSSKLLHFTDVAVNVHIN